MYSIPDTRLILAHFKHALEEVQGTYECLSASAKTDLALTLVEATQFPKLSWKRLAIEQAAIASRGLNNSYLASRVEQSQLLLGRITGSTVQPAHSVGDRTQDRADSISNERMHYAAGHAIIQRSLDCIQIEELLTAKRLLESWSPLDYNNPSLIEQVIIFRRNMLLGRTLWFLGAFEESIEHHERAWETANHCKDLIFDEDFRDLACDHADTLRELDDPCAAEHLLGAEIMRQDRLDILSRKALLELSLSEALFAQERFQEAEKLCLNIESRVSLLKMEKLCLHIMMAKLRHVQSDNEGALSYWSKALKDVHKFQLTTGRTTRIIVISTCDNLCGLGHTWLLPPSFKQVRSLDEMSKPGGAQYWIAGMRHWSDHLESGRFRSHM